MAELAAMATDKAETPYTRGMAADRESVAPLVKAADWGGAQSLPEDFADILFDFAWENRSDLQGPRFRLALNKYITSIFPDEGTQ